jgi:predicted ATPase
VPELGESVLQVLSGRLFERPGLYLLDEPEAGLAFEALLQWRDFLVAPEAFLRYLLAEED